MNKKILFLLLFFNLFLVSAFNFEFIEKFNFPSEVETTGSSNFLGLDDTPSSYTGSATDCVKVNVGGTGLVFDTCSTALSGVTLLQSANGFIALNDSDGAILMTFDTSVLNDTIDYRIGLNPESFLTEETNWNNNYSTFLDVSVWNDTGLIRDWNASGLILNWSEVITTTETNWNNNYSTFLTVSAWNDTGLIKDWSGEIISTNTSLYNWVIAQNYLTTYSETDPYWSANYSAYNTTWSTDTNTNIIDDNLYNTSELEEQGDGKLGILDSFINLLIDNKVTQAFIQALGFQTDSEINATIGIYNDSIKVYVDGQDIVYNTSIANYVDANSGVAWADVVNGTVYLSTNPYGFYNATDFDINDYSTTADIIAFGYYNATDFVITDYVTKTDLFSYGYYNSTDFDINDYFTSAEVLAFNYYNATDFDINDYITEATVLGWNYYNSTDFDINNYLTATQINATIGIYNDSMKGYVDAQDIVYNDSIKAYVDANSGTGSSISAVNITAGTYDGDITNGSYSGYAAANQICSIEYPGSHFCTEFEVQRGFALGVNALDSEDAWIIAGSPKYIPASVPVNDCNGWTYSGTSSYLGNYWHFNLTSGGDGRALNCGTAFKLACCSY